MKLKNWFITNNQDGFTPPEMLYFRACGFVYGSSKFNDGDPVTTGVITDIIDKDDYKIIKTVHSEYEVYENEIDSNYNESYPDAYKKLSIKHMSE